MLKSLRAAGLGLGLLFGLSLIGAQASAAQAQDRAAAPKVAVEGFRSAKFGMDEAALRKAAEKDFGKAAISVETNPLEKTKVLSLEAVDLLPGTGKGRVSYILGYSSQKLTQVTVVWLGTAANEAENNRLRGIASALQTYFTQAGYVKESIILEGGMPDGSQVAFHGSDDKGRLTLLRYSIGRTDDKGKMDVPVVVLTYTENPKNPDVFRIKPGSF